MNKVQWYLSLDFNPLQLSDVQVAFDSYSKPLISKFIPQLNGILVHLEKQSLKLRPASDLATERDKDYQCIVRIHPEHPTAKVHLAVNATIFCPCIGLQVEATITAVKPQRLACRYGDGFAVFISVPLQGVESEPLPIDPETGCPLQVFPQDRVHVEVSKVIRSANGESLQIVGRVISLVKRGKIGRKALDLPYEDVNGCDKQGVDENSNKSRKGKSNSEQHFGALEGHTMETSSQKVGKHKSKRLEHPSDTEEKTQAHGGGEHAPQETLLLKREPESVIEKHRKKRKRHLSDESSVVQTEEEEVLKVNKRRRKNADAALLVSDSQPLQPAETVVKREKSYFTELNKSPDIFSSSGDEASEPSPPSKPKPMKHEAR
ncbi:unnamed protein product [Mesocestoides corti]|uniref:DNA-directed RNA polymerase I subunit RPA43 n=1 Tax=Mesocestoides corti TaxID=53468 RepID=A0A158QW77_MESCO|nr:unnamed protein product [Mesocestoides corti]